MPRKKKPKIEFRYYRMPDGSPVLALLGEKWAQTYGRDVDYLHFHNYLEIGYCYEGEGVLTLGETDYRFTGKQFTIIPRNYPHTTDSDPGTISKWEYLFIDAEELLHELYQGGGNTRRVEQILYRVNSQALLKSADEFPKIAAMIRDILDIMRKTEEFYLEEVKGIIAALLVNIAREGKGERAPVEISGKMAIPISRALDYISLHYMEPLKVEELAEWCHISETHFRRVFSKYMNVGPLEYINLVRIQTACSYLKRTDESVADIASKCGFTTLSTFNRNFKQILGVSPSEWRKRPENYERQLLKFKILPKEGW